MDSFKPSGIVLDLLPSDCVDVDNERIFDICLMDVPVEDLDAHLRPPRRLIQTIEDLDLTYPGAKDVMKRISSSENQGVYIFEVPAAMLQALYSAGLVYVKTIKEVGFCGPFLQDKVFVESVLSGAAHRILTKIAVRTVLDSANCEFNN